MAPWSVVRLRVVSVSRTSVNETSALRPAALAVVSFVRRGGSVMALARLMSCVAAASLPLSATGTIDLGFTVSPSQVLLALAVIIGAQSVLRGWLMVPRPCLVAAVGLFAIYAGGVLFGSDAQLAGAGQRAASHRDVVYLADLTLGLSVIGLIVGIASDRAGLRRIVVWFCLGGGLAATYVAYQWVAQRYGWPLSDVNNAVNSDGYSFGHRFQGAGLFGWERVRGTFKEPLFLASYLSLVICLATGLALTSIGRARRCWIGVAGLTVLGLTLTVSSLAWGAIALAALSVFVLWAVASGRAGFAAVVGVVLSAMALVAPLAFVEPTLLAGPTGRSAESLRMTSANRRDAWRRVEEAWSQHPVFGYGPGQSAVRLAYSPDEGLDRRAPLVLGSAQGLWAASLIDTGLVGLFAWIGLFGSLLTFATKRLATRGAFLGLGLLGAAATALLLANLSGDRLEPRVWLVVGLVCAAACSRGETEPADGHETPG